MSDPTAASLLNVLMRCRELSSASEDFPFASRGKAGIVAALDRAIEAIATGTNLDRDGLKLLFAPTGDIQETSITNGWADEFLSLSARFDDLIV